MLAERLAGHVQPVLADDARLLPHSGDTAIDGSLSASCFLGSACFVTLVLPQPCLTCGESQEAGEREKGEGAR